MQPIKYMAWIAVLWLLGMPAFTQELTSKQQRRLNRELKKENKSDKSSEKTRLVDLMVDQRTFVLEAYQLRDRWGNMANVSSMINFLSLDSVRGVIQIGNNQYVGANGVGGITVEGTVSNYRVKENEKNGGHQVSYALRTSTGSYDVRMFVSKEGRTEATISSNWPGRVTYIGYLVPPMASKVYKGHSTY